MLQGAEGVGIDVQLQHVEYLVRKGARDSQAVWALLGVQGQHQKRGVVLETEELERGGIIEGMNVVFLGETLDEGALERA